MTHVYSLIVLSMTKEYRGYTVAYRRILASIHLHNLCTSGTTLESLNSCNTLQRRATPKDHSFRPRHVCLPEHKPSISVAKGWVVNAILKDIDLEISGP